jgi:RNA polymerase sigma-70 factor (ECF subfamily)
LTDRHSHWATLMRASNAGDAAAYRVLLAGIAPVLRGVVQRGLTRAGLGTSDAEDIVQETLLAIHLKRHTWREDEPLMPWIRAIARNKLVDALRRRGRSTNVPIDDFTDTLAAPEEERRLSPMETDKVLGMINGRSHEVVKDGPLELAGVIQQDKVPDGSAFFLEQHGHLHREKNDDGEHENADPKALRLGIFHILAQGDQEGVSHRKLASRASGPTRRTNTSCKVGSVW